MYCLLSGETPPSSVDRQKAGERFALAKLAPETSPALVSVVRAMMAADPTKRVQLLTQVVGAMCNWASEETLPTLVATHSQDIITSRQTWGQPDPADESTTQRTLADTNNIEFATPHKPKSSLGAAVGILALSLAASFGVFLYFGGGQPSLDITTASADPSAVEAAPQQVVIAPPERVETTNESTNGAANEIAGVAPNESTTPVVEQLEVAQSDATPPNDVTGGTSTPAVETTLTADLSPTDNNAILPVDVTEPIESTQPVELSQLVEPSTETRLTAIGTPIDNSLITYDESVDDYHNRLERQLHEDFGLTGGKWVLTPNEFALISSVVSYGQTVAQDETTEKEDFGRLVRMHVAGKGTKPWAAGLYIPEVNGIEKGDRVLAVVWLRTAPGSRSDGKVSIFVESASNDKKEVYLTVKPTSEWRQFLIPFQAKVARDLRVGFHLAFQKQDIDYGGLTLINFGKTAPFWNAIPAGARRRSQNP